MVGEQFRKKDSNSARFTIIFGIVNIKIGRNDTPIGANTVPGVAVLSKTPDSAVI